MKISQFLQFNIPNFILLLLLNIFYVILVTPWLNQVSLIPRVRLVQAHIFFIFLILAYFHPWPREKSWISKGKVFPPTGPGAPRGPGEPQDSAEAQI